MNIHKKKKKENKKENKLMEFFKEYPNVDIGVIGGAYVSHTGKWATDPFEAYEHVQNCSWCKKWIKDQEELDKFLRPSPAETERRIARIPEILGLTN